MGKKGMEKLPFLQAIYLQCGPKLFWSGPKRFRHGSKTKSKSEN